ncbi:hypothetical protein JNW90_28950 [Micromonospora sp. STR1s_5]|nr:hypothetical protein [Micromonospora sp. STR1s_5]
MSDGPSFGRNYDIFYNRSKTGELRLQSWLLSDELAISLDIEHVQFYPYGHLRGFLQNVAYSIAGSGSEHLVRLENEVGKCLDYTLWEIVRLPDKSHTLTFFVTGKGLGYD